MTEINAMGELISWKPPTEVALDVVRNSLTAAGLDDKLARNMAPKNAFSRAAQKLKDGRIIRQVNETKDELVFQFTREWLTKTAGVQEMEYSKECNVVLNKNSGLVSCVDQSIENLAQTQVVQAMETRKANDVTRIVQEVFAKHEGELISVREQGGVYFVPERLEHIVDKVDEFLQGVGGNLRRFRIASDGGATDVSVAQSISDHFNGLLGTLRKQVETITGESSDTVKANRHEQFVLLRGKLAAYRNLLREFAGEIETGIGSVEQLYLDRLNGAATEPPDSGAAEATPAMTNFDEAFDRLRRSIASAPSV